jgi:hypothetical protein
MKPIIGKPDEKSLILIMGYLHEGGDPSIKFVQEFFNKYEIKQDKFLAYLKEHGPFSTREKLRQQKMLR